MWFADVRKANLLNACVVMQTASTLLGLVFSLPIACEIQRIVLSFRTKQPNPLGVRYVKELVVVCAAVCSRHGEVKKSCCKV